MYQPIQKRLRPSAAHGRAPGMDGLQFVDDETYNDMPGERFTYLKEMGKSPYAYKVARDFEREDTEAFVVGRAFHVATLLPEEMGSRYAFTAHRKNTNAWKSDLAAAGSKDMLKLKEGELIDRMAMSARRHKLSGPMIDAATCEVSGQWKDPATGLLCKVKVDGLSIKDGFFFDLKSTRSVVLREFAWNAHSYKYFHQLAFYKRGIKAITGHDLDPFLIAVEKSRSADVLVCPVTSSSMAKAYADIDGWLAELAECKRTERYPGVCQQPIELDMPASAYDDDDLSLDIGGEEHAI